MTNTLVPVVSFEPVKYVACALPTRHPDYADYVIRVVFRPRHGQWEVFHAGPRGEGGHGGKYLNAGGKWCSPDEHHWWSRDDHHFDLDTARALAMDAALTVTVHDRTAADVLAADKSAVVR
ncbi:MULTISPECIES: hypothetical protein [unclassified Streptomyces]|uniref:hypothetical protein n=1 Tax=unclassified Streptomyces TaxID=2593676 RepID=UPI00278BD1D3|nr:MULTISPECIES: hypothetical protein [unclassified Streptomyces]